jgi:hypothetical protein
VGGPPYVIYDLCIKLGKIDMVQGVLTYVGHMV